MAEREPIGVTVIVLNEQGQMLMGERTNIFGSGLYGSPGGRIEKNESIAETAKRELAEETGLVAGAVEFIGVVREKREPASFMHFGFLATETTGAPKNLEPEKCREWEWFSADELPDNILPGHKAVIDMYLNPQSPRFRDI